MKKNMTEVADQTIENLFKMKHKIEEYESQGYYIMRETLKALVKERRREYPSEFMMGWYEGRIQATATLLGYSHKEIEGILSKKKDRHRLSDAVKIPRAKKSDREREIS